MGSYLIYLYTCQKFLLRKLSLMFLELNQIKYLLLMVLQSFNLIFLKQPYWG